MRNIGGILFSCLPARIRNVCTYRLLLKTDFPEIVHIENTNACNARCMMCPREKMLRDIGFMDFSLFRKIIDECALYSQVREVHLHGFGECLLECSLASKVRYAKQKGIKSTYIVTNGSLLRDACARDLILSGLDRIKVSFYGATKSTYEKIHINLDFDEVENNVLDLFKLRNRLRRTNPAVFLQFLPLRENIHERELFFRKWSPIIERDKGDALTEFTLHNYGRGRNYNTFENSNNLKKNCVLPFNSMQILWNGDVVPCCFDFNGDMILTNVKNLTLKQAWDCSSFNKLRLALKKREFNGAPLCGKCDQIIKKHSRGEQWL